ncbi:MAG: ribosomal-protein-alanine N-acetyltransferase [Gammaproteobacteria bacterium]|jgi:ribosomal protein S18 acetylase RimI-like enzyme|nr:ribosomal-protein-alanine N-acetyltransferase [Gammaproteobacteria bacterium]
MIKQITKLSKLQKTDIRHIKRLIDICKDQDGYRMKVYWHIIPQRLTQEFNDFLYFIDGNLIGYLALFSFNMTEVELTACVHPKYRRQGIFKKMLSEALLEMRQRHIPNCLWMCPQNSVIGEEQMKALHAKYTFSQVEMIAKHPPMQKSKPVVILREANKADLPLLSQLGATAFNASLTETYTRFSENMNEKNRIAWLVSSEHEENIGKIHVRFDDHQTAFIHDLCIQSKLQGRGYGFAMIIQVMEMLYKKGWKRLVLDVECDNKGALKLYEQCGFEVTDGYDFWRVPTKHMLEKWHAF